MVHFEIALLVQSILLVFFQLALLYVCLRYRPATKPKGDLGGAGLEREGGGADLSAEAERNEEPREHDSLLSPGRHDGSRPSSPSPSRSAVAIAAKEQSVIIRTPSMKLRGDTSLSEGEEVENDVPINGRAVRAGVVDRVGPGLVLGKKRRRPFNFWEWESFGVSPFAFSSRYEGGIRNDGPAFVIRRIWSLWHS